MIRFSLACGLAVNLVVAGCTSPVKYGDKSYESNLKQLAAVSDKVSLYVCREDGWGSRKLRSTVFVDGKAIGMLMPKMFAHTTLNPGSHNVYLSNEAPIMPTAKTGELKISGSAGDVVILWVGVTGGGWGALTVDYFETNAAAKQCMNDASYAVNAD